MSVMETDRRLRLSEKDLEFLMRSLAKDDRGRNALLALLVDPGTVDSLLDNSTLLDFILDGHETLEISQFLYFYLLVRSSFQEVGLMDPDLADYVAGVLADLSSSWLPGRGGRSALPYVIDLSEDLNRVQSPYERFFLSVRVGNFLLVATGIFHAHLVERSERRGAPGLAYYEDFGAGVFREAGNHPLAKEFLMEDRFFQLSEEFSASRRALNRLSDQFLLWN